MIFKTQYDLHDRVNTSVGDRIHKLYSGKYDDTGRVVLTDAGTEDIYAYIQSHADSVDIHILMKRFQNGEIDVLSRVKGFYADTTEFPKTYAELLNSIEDGKRLFASLPSDVREKFNNSVTEFLSASDKPDFLEKLSAAPAVSKIDDVKEEEKTE